MKRRNFLTSLFGLLALPFAPKAEADAVAGSGESFTIAELSRYDNGPSPESVRELWRKGAMLAEQNEDFIATIFDSKTSKFHFIRTPRP